MKLPFNFSRPLIFKTPVVVKYFLKNNDFQFFNVM